MAVHWFSYDDVAEDYASCAAPRLFAAPARDLIALLAPTAGARLLDAGTGSGVIAAAARTFQPQLGITGCDLSVGMVAAARRRVPGASWLTAEIGRLPFTAGSFDYAALGFVLSHVTNPVAALAEVCRVVRAAVAVSAWSASAGTTEPGELWRAACEAYADPSELEQAAAAAVPAEDLLADLGGLRGVLAAAGLHHVRAEVHEYEVTMPTNEFIASRLLTAATRYLRTRLSRTEWDAFLRDAMHRLTGRFGSSIRLRLTVNIGTGRPGR